MLPFTLLCVTRDTLLCVARDTLLCVARDTKKLKEEDEDVDWGALRPGRIRLEILQNKNYYLTMAYFLRRTL